MLLATSGTACFSFVRVPLARSDLLYCNRDLNVAYTARLIYIARQMSVVFSLQHSLTPVEKKHQQVRDVLEKHELDRRRDTRLGSCS